MSDGPLSLDGLPSLWDVQHPLPIVNGQWGRAEGPFADMWKLFPTIGKVPALPGDWREHATSDAYVIEGWRDAGYDLAVDCEASGLMVIDLDGEEGLATANMMDLPDTYTMRTPRGGMHLYYEGLGPSSVQKLGPKVDTRSVGGYVIWEAPGYEPIDERNVVGAPDWVVPALNIRKDRKLSQSESLDLPANIKRAEQYLSIRRPAIEGEGGNDHTYQTAQALRDLGLSEGRAFELLLQEWNLRCTPPWDEEDLETLVSNAYRYGQNEEGAQAFSTDPATRFSGVNYAAVPMEERPSRFRLWSLAEARSRPKPTFLFDGILPAKSFGIAYGPMENGKTWLLIDMAMRVALGWDLSGQQANQPRDVVFFAGEGFEDIVHSRCQAWCDYHGVERDPPHLHLLENFPNVVSEDEIDELCEQVKQRCADVALMIVDTYARAMAEGGLSENDPLDVMKFVRQMEVLKRGFGCTVLAVHHSGKDLERRARGSNSLMAAADFGFEITAEWEVMALQLKCAKMKAAKRFEPLYYEAVPYSGSLVVRGIPGSTNMHHLASRLYKPERGEPEAEIQAKVDRIARKLTKTWGSE